MDVQEELPKLIGRRMNGVSQWSKDTGGESIMNGFHLKGTT